MKYLLLLGMIAAGGFVIFAHAQGDAVADSYVPDFTWEDIEAISRRRTDLAAKWDSAQRFHKHLEAVKRDLWKRQTSLAAAADAVCQVAARDGSTFRSVLGLRYPALSERERVALALLSHLREETGTKAVPLGHESIPDELRCELEAWPGVNPATLETLATEDSCYAVPPTSPAPAP